ncbi:ATP-dependent Clp protease protease subunit [Pantoea allii]|uniref:ATP-dependent Clp protease protease subunit n=1 Tax=Pantoea allii TaxID=574096 RepID=A0A2V2BC45_9GAMM|nr:ATP-dependent Clp protease proteolytic subunit [Pantoea allii]PWK94308.1 ATP-dependent Clp protease protease subunit [Pantoea allii]
MKMKSLSAVLLGTLLMSAESHGNVTFIKNNTLSNAQVKEAALYFNGAVNNQTVTWLLSALAEIHENYLNVENVDIYLNSRGGDMDAAYVAYEALRKSPMKLSMINSAMTASSATMIYCASHERYAMPLSQFVLHPAAATNEKADYLRPDQAKRILDEDENYNSMFLKIYTSCVRLSDKEQNDITWSESGRLVLKADEASKRGLVTKGNKESRSYLLTYYVTDSQG